VSQTCRSSPPPHPSSLSLVLFRLFLSPVSYLTFNFVCRYRSVFSCPPHPPCRAIVTPPRPDISVDLPAPAACSAFIMQASPDRDRDPFPTTIPNQILISLFFTCRCADGDQSRLLVSNGSSGVFESFLASTNHQPPPPPPPLALSPLPATVFPCVISTIPHLLFRFCSIARCTSAAAASGLRPASSLASPPVSACVYIQ
jgi:hypothetical protein